MSSGLYMHTHRYRCPHYQQINTPMLKVLQKQPFTIATFHTVKTQPELMKIKQSEYSIIQVQLDISLPFLFLL